jgi:hypothetical protein
MEFIEDYEFYNLEGKQILMEIKQHFTASQIYDMMFKGNLIDLPIYEKIQKVMSAYNKYDLYRLYKFMVSITDDGFFLKNYEMKKLIENYKDPEDMNFSNFEVNSLVCRAYFKHYRYKKNTILPKMGYFIKEYIKNSPL